MTINDKYYRPQALAAIVSSRSYFEGPNFFYKNTKSVM